MFVYLIVVVSALLSTAFFSRLFGVAPPEGRIGAVDGLRGFLALGVFAYHFVLWREVLQGQYWGAPVSHFEYQLGQVGVSFFFMITAFLFCRTVVFSTRVDWRSLYIGRCSGSIRFISSWSC
ncbi:acyltransferase family protein [Paracoccus marinaquae]|uniref:Acyltransferase family protein n=1 Tax=Paracoccus marinaquae TaxID=2841926 RepID=A0ABS6AIX6_9RHOB|nr:acyltransferase family protein [Paracoccus marinaquae]MBU3030554.1 acyltransferase family protein [Paracoccus marinaquae]